MAIPPAALASIAEDVDFAVIAEVQAIWDAEQEIWREQAASAKPQHDAQHATHVAGRGPIGAAPPQPAQRCRLQVQKIIKGQVENLLEVQKPVSLYVLAPGHHGPFLLAASDNLPVIIGRYGPDSYSQEEVEALFLQSQTSREND